MKIFDQHVDVLICVLINTSTPSHWLKSVAWPVGPVLKFRDILTDYRQINSHSNTGEESKHTSHHNQLSNSDIAMYAVYPQTDMTNNMCDGSNCTTHWHCYVRCLLPDRHDEQYVRWFKLHHSMTLLCTLSIPGQIWQTILKTVQIAPLMLSLVTRN